jgi:putative endonuclease
MRDEKQPAVYIMSNAPRGTLYLGVTSALWNRVATHKDGSLAGFTTKYLLKSLVWYEHHEDMNMAISREKQLKKWRRAWKIDLIASFNPHWLDLHDDIDVEHKYTATKLDSRLRGNDDVSD